MLVIHEFLHSIINPITTKYNIFTFLPKGLFYQFMRLANVYFLFTAILQCIPVISPLGSATALFPIIFVLAVSLIREGYEDCKRANLDKIQNSVKCKVYRNESWIDIESGDLELGEIVIVEQDEIFPADLVLLDSPLSEGICFIETGSLDGEKTLKQKNPNADTVGKFTKEKYYNADTRNVNLEDTPTLKPGDYIKSIYNTTTQNTLLLFTNLGNYLYMPVHIIQYIG